MILKRIKRLKENEIIIPNVYTFFMSVLTFSAIAVFLIPTVLALVLPSEVLFMPITISFIIGVASFSYVNRSVADCEIDETKEDNDHLLQQIDKMGKQAAEDSIMFYKNRFDLLDLPFLPEDFGFSETVIAEEGTTRIYSSQGFTMMRGEDNKWIVANPDKESSSYYFKKAFHAYHTLAALGYDHSSWDQSIATKN